MRRLFFFAESVEKDSQEVLTDCVVDLNGFRDMIGIEFLGLRDLIDVDRLVGISEAMCESGQKARCSYDADSDAMYISLSDERSMDQEVRRCEMVKGLDGRLISIDVEDEKP